MNNVTRAIFLGVLAVLIQSLPALAMYTPNPAGRWEPNHFFLAGDFHGQAVVEAVYGPPAFAIHERNGAACQCTFFARTRSHRWRGFSKTSLVWMGSRTPWRTRCVRHRQPSRGRTGGRC